MQNIILLHGALGSAADLAPLDAALKSEGLKPHILSFSGHGGNAFETYFSIGQFSQELDKYINQMQLKPAYLFGYSMGGFVALHLASKLSGSIAGIVTLGTKFNWSREAVEKETKLLNPEVMAEKVPAFAKALEAKHGSSWAKTVTHTAALMREIEEKKHLSPEQLKNITVPVLLGIGDRDQMVSTEETAAVYKTLPNAAMYMLPKTKHQIETVNVNVLSRLIVDFIVP